jgi:hypothetical protein
MKPRLELTPRWCSLRPRPLALALAGPAFLASLILVAMFVVTTTAVATMAVFLLPEGKRITRDDDSC